VRVWDTGIENAFPKENHDNARQTAPHFRRGLRSNQRIQIANRYFEGQHRRHLVFQRVCSPTYFVLSIRIQKQKGQGLIEIILIISVRFSIRQTMPGVWPMSCNHWNRSRKLALQHQGKWFCFKDW